MSKAAARKKEHVKGKLAQRRPTVCVGKGGATTELLKEITEQLKREKMVKIRILKSALAQGDARSIAKRIAELTEASLVEVRGHTFTLYKPDED